MNGYILHHQVALCYIVVCAQMHFVAKVQQLIQCKHCTVDWMVSGIVSVVAVVSFVGVAK